MPSNKNSEKILDEKGISRAIKRMAHEIIERNHGVEDVALVGILTRGAELAERLRDIIKDLEGVDVDFGLMDINLYRDDAATRLDQPVIQKTEILFDMSVRNIVLVDDVLFTGRTVRAAIDQLIDFGRPKTIQLAVLIDRGHRELPIRADYVGKNAPTSRHDDIQVLLKNTDNAEEVCLTRIKRPSAKKIARKKS